MTPPQGDNRGSAITPARQQPIVNLIQSFPVLEPFPVGQNDFRRRDPEGLEGSHQPIQVERGDRRVGDDSHTPDMGRLLQQLGLAKKAWPDVDGVASAAQGDAEGLHRFASSFSIARVMLPGLPRLPSTTMWATSR